MKECQLRLSGDTGFGRFPLTAPLCLHRWLRSQHLVREARRGGEADACSALHVLCGVHRISLLHGKTCTSLDDGLRGMLCWALSLRDVAALSRFRRFLKNEIASRMHIIYGRRPVEAVAHKKKQLSECLWRTGNLAVRRVLLAVCPSGDWRAQQVQCFVGAHLESEADRNAILTHLTSGFSTALLSTRPGLYFRL